MMRHRRDPCSYNARLQYAGQKDTRVRTHCHVTTACKSSPCTSSPLSATILYTHQHLCLHGHAPLAASILAQNLCRQPLPGGRGTIFKSKAKVRICTTMARRPSCAPCPWPRASPAAPVRECRRPTARRPCLLTVTRVAHSQHGVEDMPKFWRLS